MPRLRAGTLAEHHELTWESLADAFDGLLAEREYDRITLADVARRAGIARNTIYNYAPDKATLLARIVARTGADLTRRVTELAADRDRPAADRLAETVRTLLTAFTAGAPRIFVLRTLLGSVSPAEQDSARAPLDTVQLAIARLVADGVASGELRPVDDVGLAVELLSGLMDAAARRAARDAGHAPAVVAEAVDLVLRAVGSR